jgi:hypothetical protein
MILCVSYVKVKEVLQFQFYAIVLHEYKRLHKSSALR